METLASYRRNKVLIHFSPNLIIIFRGSYHFRMTFQNNVHKTLLMHIYKNILCISLILHKQAI